MVPWSSRFLFSVALQSNSGLDCFNVEVSSSTDTHTFWTSDQPFAEAATYTRHDKQRRRTSMSSAGFESAIPAIKRLQTYALDRTHLGWRNNRVADHSRVPFTRKLLADYIRGILATFHFKIFCFPVKQNYNFTCCLVWVWSLVSPVKGRTFSKDVWEQGAR